MQHAILKRLVGSVLFYDSSTLVLCCLDHSLFFIMPPKFDPNAVSVGKTCCHVAMHVGSHFVDLYRSGVADLSQVVVTFIGPVRTLVTRGSNIYAFFGLDHC